MPRFLLTTLLLCITCGSAAAQDSGVVERVRALYQELDYEEAERRAMRAIDNADVYDVDELAELHALLALIHYVQQNEVGARSEFLTALSLKPDLVLDPVLVPPRAITFFDQLREEVLQEDPPDDVLVRRYILLSDPRPAAAMRSALIPGWGQMYKGETTKGWVVAGLFAGTTGGSLALHLTDDGGSDAGGDSPLLRDALSVAAAGIWLYSYLDALMNETTQRRPTSRLNLHAAPTAGGVQVGGTLTF